MRIAGLRERGHGNHHAALTLDVPAHIGQRSAETHMIVDEKILSPRSDGSTKSRWRDDPMP
jgi:hypothetical protein